MTLQLNDISIHLDHRVLVKPFSISVAAGEVLTIMGASGSGKSSILSQVGGDLASAFSTQGEVILKDRNITTLPPHQRHVARLFQDDLLFPHMTVGENLLFGIPHTHHTRHSRAGMTDRKEMMRAALRDVELDEFENRPPHTLSGGQRSRVALMRALLSDPDAILLDEPFSKLDQDLRAAMRDVTFARTRERNIPAILVTHDRGDAPLSGRVLKLIDGEMRDA